jgi:membrane fusion protein, heavy metal efflux system
MKQLLIICTAVFFMATISACGSKQAVEQPVAAAEEAHEHDETNAATLTEAQMKAIGVEVSTLEQKQLTASLKANGVLLVPNQNKASISTVYSGVVKTLLVQPGSVVRKGQVIATVANPDFITAQQDYLGLDAKISLAELEYNRQKELNAGNAGALRNLQSAEAELKTLRARKSALEQQLQLMGIRASSISNNHLITVLSITSPIQGVVSAVGVKLGSYVDVATSIAEIVDNSQLHLDLFVYEKDLPKLKEKQLIHFTLTNYPGREYDAEIFSLGSSFEGESKAVSVHAKVKGDKTGLIDGMNITAIVSLDKATVPAVPNDAIVSYQGQDYIFIVSAAGDHQHKEGEEGITFEKVAVAKGTTDIGYTEITPLTAIPANAKIVTKGAFFVLAKLTNSGGEHEH